MSAVPDFRHVTVEALAQQVRDRELSAAVVTDAALANGATHVSVHAERLG